MNFSSDDGYVDGDEFTDWARNILSRVWEMRFMYEDILIQKEGKNLAGMYIRLYSETPNIGICFFVPYNYAPF